MSTTPLRDLDVLDWGTLAYGEACSRQKGLGVRLDLAEVGKRFVEEFVKSFGYSE